MSVGRYRRKAVALGESKKRHATGLLSHMAPAIEEAVGSRADGLIPEHIYFVVGVLAPQRAVNLLRMRGRLTNSAEHRCWVHRPHAGGTNTDSSVATFSGPVVRFLFR